MKQFNHLRKELNVRNNKNCSTVELDNVNVTIPHKKTLLPNGIEKPNKIKAKFKLPEINNDKR